MQTESAGLTSSEVQRLTKQGKTNAQPNKSSMSTAGIVASNVLTYFNGIFCALAVLLVVAGSFRSLTFLPVVIANTVIGIVQQIRSKKVLDELALLDVSEYVAIRDGESVPVASDALVLGDVIQLQSGQQIPADAVVVSGEASVNESLLTGEADEIQKREGSELMSGSFVVAGELLARLTHVGSESYAAHLTAEAKRAIERPSEMVSNIERIILVSGILIIPVGGLLYWEATTSAGMTFSEAIVSMVGAVIGMIPEGLYLLVTVALALSAMRLAKVKVLLHDMHSIETLARVDVLCADKTGTITSENMIVREAFDAADSSAGAVVDDAKALLARYAATVPDDNITMQALRAWLPEAEPIREADVTPFSSKLKYSQVATKAVAWRLGAPEFLLSSEQLDECRGAIESRASKGMRVLALVEVTDRETRPLTFVAISNEVRPDARKTFSYFATQGVEVKVISGDNPLTVSKVAEDAGIPNANRYVDASTLVTEEQVRDAACAYTVFGRVKPEQKRLLVRALRDSGKRVAMTGDGVNDILAMKESDCSIAMGGGSDAARQAAQVVLLDSDFSHMREIVGEGRRDINNITRSATLFLYKNIFSMLLALFAIFGAFAYPLTPNQVALVSLFNVGLPAFFLAFEPNEKKQEGSFISTVLLRSLPASLTSFVAIADLMLFADLFGVTKEDVGMASLYLLAVVGFLILLQLIQPPNRYRVIVFLLCMAGLVLCCAFLWIVFDIHEMSMRSWALCAVFAFAEVGVLQPMEVIVEAVSKRVRTRSR